MLICIQVCWYIFICNYFKKQNIFLSFLFHFLYFSQVKWKSTLLLTNLIITFGLSIPNTTWKSNEISDSLSVKFFGQIGSHIEPTKAPASLAPSRETFNILHSNTLKCLPWLFMFLDFFVKHFPNYLSCSYKKLFFADDFLKIHIFNKIFVWL